MRKKKIVVPCNYAMVSGLLCIMAVLQPATGFAATGETLGARLSLWSVLPFIGILLSIAIAPILNLHWWEQNMGKVSFFWGCAFFLPFIIGFGFKQAFYQLLHIYVIDYIPFIILLTALFVISGGIVVRGSLAGTPVVNTAILGVGAVLASIIGTTGASMLLIRPLIRAMACREHKVHTIIFFIFLVGNIGGSLTPVGDPPLFLGFLHGVPFFWTLKLLPLFLVNVLGLLGIYFFMDSYLIKKEAPVSPQMQPADAGGKQPLRVVGLMNFAFIGGVIAAIVFSGLFAKHPFFFDSTAGHDRGIGLLTADGHTLVMPLINICRDSVIALLALLSLRLTPPALRRENEFTWGPIKEVAVLFAGIFATIIPAIAILQSRGGELGVTTPAQFFWATGMLSGFLDNAPTYLVFLSIAGGLGTVSGVWTDLGTLAPDVLMAISAGSVFMGANTYIGNAPNFMVRSIAEGSGIKMPSFFAYMGWSLSILIPLFILNTFLFFQ